MLSPAELRAVAENARALALAARKRGSTRMLLNPLDVLALADAVTPTAGTVRAPQAGRWLLANCAAGGNLGHAACHGWQLQLRHLRPHGVLICSCDCQHLAAQQLVERGILDPPPGWSIAEFLTALADRSHVSTNQNGESHA